MSVLHQDSGGIGKSIPSALEIFLGRGFCTPRPSGFPSGFALGKSLGSRGAKPTASENLSRFPSTLEISLGLRPREISWVSGNWAAGMDFPIPPSSWWSTDTFHDLYKSSIKRALENVSHICKYIHEPIGLSSFKTTH